jgi:hypothetical protein
MSEGEMEKERYKARERMRKSRNVISNGEKEEQKENDMEEEKEEGENWYAKLKARSKLAMIEKREKQTSEEREVENCDARSGMKNFREKKSAEEKEYDKISEKYRKRESRAKRTEADHSIKKHKAKHGMKLLKERGRIKNVKRRCVKNNDRDSDWKEFMKKGKPYTEYLSFKQPDIIARLNEEIREEKEKERTRKEREKEKEKAGDWIYNGESGEWNWTGPNVPDFGDTFTFNPPTEEEKEIAREAEEREFEWFVEQRAEERKEKRKQKYKEIKEKMATPIDPLPKPKLCAYEKLREDIIEEREKAMRESGFFEDLRKTKEEIGLTKNICAKKQK